MRASTSGYGVDCEGRSTITELRVRRSLHELQAWYEAGNTKPREDLWTAWRTIKELPADNPQSFFTLGGYHGEPFQGPGLKQAEYWGGYCNHGNVLFPTWHRVYLLKLEQALQSVPGCQDVMLPYWDQTSADSLAGGIPWALTRKTVKVNGETIDNPLRSFRFNADIVDAVTGQNSLYRKPRGYETVRYPLSGLVGTSDAQQATEEHNNLFRTKDGRLDYDLCEVSGSVGFPQQFVLCAGVAAGRAAALASVCWSRQGQLGRADRSTFGGADHRGLSAHLA
jgi:hypothetical protein